MSQSAAQAPALQISPAAQLVPSATLVQDVVLDEGAQRLQSLPGSTSLDA
jgi:hypothetical protein